MKSRPKRPHLLRVDRTLLEFAQLVAALRQDGHRAGWLEWAPGVPPEPPLAFPAAGDSGVARAVRVDAERNLAVKCRRGPPVLADVLREHFHGDLLVLILLDGENEDPLLREAPRLDPTSAGWRVTPPDGPPRELTTAQLAAELRRPRPFAKD